MGEIVVLGLGWEARQLTLEAVDWLNSGARILLHTGRCGCAEWLTSRGMAFETLDALYERCEDFDEHAREAAEAVLSAAKSGDVVYGVADVRDRSAVELTRRLNGGARVVAGPPSEGALMAFVGGEARMVEASDWEDFHLTARENCLIRELDSRELAAEVKLRLLDVYPEDTRIWVLNANAAPASMALFELDRAERYDHRTCALIPAQRSVTALERYDFEHLNEIMRLLCGPGGCPWDRAQTHESLRTCMLEEAYEVMEAIDEGDPDHLYDELGDMLLQVALHAEIARRHGEFDISDVTTAICEKMIHRHTHIFGGDRAEDPESVMDLWSRNKRAERGQHTYTEALRDVTRTLPATLRAVKVLKRAAEAGLCEKDPKAVAMRAAGRIEGVVDGDRREERLGEALFDLAALARIFDVDPEIALTNAVNRFIERFEAVERRAEAEGKTMDDLSPETLRQYWDLVKL